MDNNDTRLMNCSDKFEKESNGEDKELKETRKIMEERAKIFESMSKYEKKLIRGFMSGFSSAMILWLINKKRQHGYKIMTKLHESFPYDEKMPSKIYPVLYDLEKNGLIEGSWEYLGKRKIKYYEITDEGKQVLLKFKELAKPYYKNYSSIWIEFMQDMIPDKDNNE